MDSLASRLRSARESKGLTQTQLAKASGVSQGTIGNIEAGIRAGSQSLAEIAQVLEVSYRWLRDGAGNMRQPSLAWPLSQHLLEVLTDSPADVVRRVENAARAVLDMPPIPAESTARPGSKPGKPHGRAA